MSAEFKLQIEPNGECTVRQGTAPDVFVYEGFTYEVETVQSFSDLVKAKATKENCVVFVNNDFSVAILDDTVTTRPKDRVVYNFHASTQFGEWRNVLTKAQEFNVKQMVEFLKQRKKGEIPAEEHGQLLYAAQNFKYAILTSGDFTYSNDSNFVVAIKVKDTEGTVLVPEQVTLNLETFKGSNFIQEVQIKIEPMKFPALADKPVSPGFRMSCPGWPRYYEDAIEAAHKQLCEQLEGYLIVRGIV